MSLRKAEFSTGYVKGGLIAPLGVEGPEGFGTGSELNRAETGAGRIGGGREDGGLGR